MSLLVVGSIAFDSIHTPTEVRENILGGSSVHFSYAASFFSGVRMVGVVGEDWQEEHTQLLTERGIDTSGIEIEEGGKTFRWTGKYHSNMNDRDTLEVHLNVLETFNPTLSEESSRCPFVFLANGSPTTQLKVLEQMTGPRLVVADTMDLWIEIERDQLKTLLSRVDGLVLNDSEAKQLTEEENLVRAGQKVLEMGPKFIILKKGEHGAMFFSKNETYVMPAFPTPDVVDPTGAGDSFAGGMMGYLAQQNNFDPKTLKEAMAYGTVVASLIVEDFSLDRLKGTNREEIDSRFNQYRQMLTF
ncbi:PfkB family carbohydrate kinase [Bremerella sp. JC817]|uniref:PfkB family carbohydrate kinase n=1 Tax=Bremerella sp. JC817 TaxID=3231756 RepID=UPI0034594563